VPSEILVDVESVGFTYDRRPVLKGISMRIPRGKIVALMGASGSGKTTMLRIIGGQLKPHEGRVSVDGRPVADLSIEDLYLMRRRMGMLYQFGALFSDMTVFENVAFPLREHTQLPEGMIRDLVLMKLEAVGMRGAHRLMPAELSGGMARRVALARAVVLDPMLVMYDEPFAGLDPISLNVIATLIRKLNDALGLTSIVVTYDVSESLKLVDYIYVIAEGRLMGEGTPDELLASEDPYLKQFLKALPDGPVRFHFPAKPLDEELRLSPSSRPSG